ncbi:MAG: hypothetical protein JRF58_10955 [Deltaproteobacteria bacterium]|nr:hypothetical protein [Deltaproteobacteria bacterium]
MARLKILAPGSTKHARTQARGKLFEGLVYQVLDHYGYRVDRLFHANYPGMEIEVEGTHTTTGVPFYADCTFCETPVSAPYLQAFYGKYMARWHQEKRCHGLFIALPGIDSSAGEFYRNYIAKNSDVTAVLYEEDAVLKAVSASPGVAGPDAHAKHVLRNMGTSGDPFLFYTGKSVFWAWIITSEGKENRNRLALFDKTGSLVSDPSVLGYLTELYPKLADFDPIVREETVVLQPGLFQDADEIVEVRGGPECFAYQYPASPGDFVGRKPLLKALDAFAKKVTHKETSHRGVLFEGPSGWGKSSLVLASVARLEKMAHFAVAIDSRTAASPNFIPRLIHDTIEKYGDFGGMLPQGDRSKWMTVGDRGIGSILEMGKVLESNGKLLFIFLDQFDPCFSLPEVIEPIKDLFLKICREQTNIVLGFSWNKDLVSAAHGLYGELGDAVTDNSQKMILNSFSGAETDALLKKLSDELNETLIGDLRWFLMEFSQGYPWLLKMLCFHVKVARQSGIPQDDIAGNLLSVQELFQHDLEKLSDKGRVSLSHIAKFAPMRPTESPGNLDAQVVQNLIDQRLVLKIGNTVDVSGEVFRNYLNSGKLPFHDNPILGAGVRDVVDAAKILHAAGGSLDISELRGRTGLSGPPFYRVAKGLDLLGLVRFSKGASTLEVGLPAPHHDMEASLRKHLQDRLRGNRLVRGLLKILKEKNTLTMDDVSARFEISVPYRSVAGKAGLKYVRILAEWMDFADLGIWDKKNRILVFFDPATEIRERRLLLPKRRGSKIPQIQYSPVEKVAERLFQALQGDGRVDWTGFGKNTIFRALATLEDLGFIVRRAPLIKMLPRGREFVQNRDKRPALFAEGALQMPSFSIFMELLESHRFKGNTLLGLGVELEEKLGTNWKESTAENSAKIMLDWARHAKLAPGVFARIRKGPIKGWKKKDDRQMVLF